MKEKLQNNLLYTFIVLILGVSIYCAKNLGDKVTVFQSYKNLEAIIQLTQPIHLSINQIENERSLSSIYLALKNQQASDALATQHQSSDNMLGQFAKQLNISEIRFLAMPESDLSKIRKEITDHRSKIDSESMTFSFNYSFYNKVVADFENFLSKMYTYPDSPEFLSLVSLLKNMEYLKDSIAKECSYGAYHVSLNEIPVGVVPIIRQMISEQLIYDDIFNDVADNELERKFVHINSSPEKNAIIQQRERFNENKPDLIGDIQAGKKYFEVCNSYLNHFYRLEESILLKLNTMAKTGKEKLKMEIILLSIVGIGAVLMLLGIYFLIKKIATK